MSHVYTEGFFATPSPFEITRVSVDTINWEPIIAPIPCNGFSITNSTFAEFLFRRRDTDPNSEFPVGFGNAYVFDHSKGNERGPRGELEYIRFEAGSIVGWCKANSGVGPLIVTWFR